MLLKEVYSNEFLQELTAAILSLDKKFDDKKFLRNFVGKSWEDKALKQRMRAVAIALDECFVVKNYQEKVEVLKEVAGKITKGTGARLALICFPDFVEVFGSIPTFDFSMQALAALTEFGTSEFAVRQFLKLDEKRALTFFKKWAKDPNHHIRRLASEGCRPRLPWGESLPSFKKNPQAILPILEELKNDESEYVRKSVANNLNDISKDNPAVVLELLGKWKNTVSSRLIAHSLRTLLKRGNKEALKLIDIDSNILSENFTIQSFALEKEVIKISQNMTFDFALRNQASNKKIRIEYAVYFLNKNGSHGKKIFQITTKNFAEGVFNFTKKHSFRDLSTRKHNAGKHAIALVVNGVEVEKKEFDLF